MEAGCLDPAPIWTDVKTFPWHQFRDRVDVLTGGYPCQPFSSAGLRKGTDDPRHLWPFISSGIQVVRPRLCFFENVEGHISLGLREVIADLESLGYETAWGIFSASEVGAPHQRKRVFIMAYRNSERGQLSNWWKQSTEQMSISNGEAWRDVWPSRPGQPQHAWEPPRVVADSRCGQRSRGEIIEGAICARESKFGEAGESVGNSESGQDHGRESRDLGIASRQGQCGNDAADSAGEELGNALGGTRLGRASRDERHAAQSDETSIERQTQPTLGLHIDESSSVLGEALTLNPYVANVDGHENLSQKTRARQILFEVWKQASSKTIQWETRGLQCFLAEKILLSGMQLDSFTQRICYFIWCVQTGHKAQGWGLRGMWVYESCGKTSQGQEPIEQLKRELGYALCQLSYEIALERGEEAVETKGILQGMREASERAWALSDALPEMEEVWRSTLNQKVWENGCFNEATSKGNRTDELRLLGNGVVPATAALAFQTLLNGLRTC